MDELESVSTPSVDGDEISLIDLAAVLWRRRLLIVLVTILAAILSVVYALMQPNVYTSQTTLMPLAADSKSALSEYAGIAQMAGVSLPGGSTASPVMKIQAVLKSRTLAEELAQGLDLPSRLIKDPEKLKGQNPMVYAVEALQAGMFTVSVDEKTAIIKVSGVTKDPVLSRDIASKGVEVLERLLNEKAFTVSAKSIRVLEVQVAEQDKKVRDLQKKILSFQDRTKMLSPTGQVQQSMNLYQNLITQKISLEVEISRLENVLSSDNPKLTLAKSQLEAVKKQIVKLEQSGMGVGPGLSETSSAVTEYQNMAAELTLNASMYASLSGALERQRLQSGEDSLFVEVIDPAIVPNKKSAPSRTMICVVGTMAGGFMAVLLAFVLDALKKILSDPEVRKKFQSTSASRRARRPD